MALFELLAAVAVIGVAVAMLAAILVAARRAERLGAESASAFSAAQGAFERLRGAPPAELPGAQASRLPLPPETARLRGAALTASCADWPGQPGLRRLRVVLAWQPFPGSQRQVVCDGLISDARQR